MELKKDNIFRSISNTLNPSAQKTSFGTIYAVVLIILMAFMSIGQFFFPISTLKASGGGDKYSVSLSQLAFKPAGYKIDITCNNNHSLLAINAVLSISFICLAVCAVLTVIGIIQMLKNTNRACTTLTVAFIPMVLAKLSLFLPYIQLKNFEKIYVRADKLVMIADSVYFPIIPILMLIASVCIPIVSLKVIHRT